MAKLTALVEVKDLYDVNEAAKKLKCGVATVWRRVKEGKINAIRISGRTYFAKTEIDRTKN